MNNISFPKVGDTVPKYLKMEELERLRQFVLGNLKYRAVIEVLYATGIRISELAAMKKEDINWSERTIIIPNGKGKKGRFVLFTQNCSQYLKLYLEERTDDLSYVFTNTAATGPICVRTISQKFERYRRKLDFFITPHTLRHTFAAHLAMKGMSLVCIQVLLGHNDPRQTHLYARLYDQARKDKYDEFM